jgi:galactokinase
MNIENFKTVFKKLYQADPIIIRSPGRINIIGEHTDYNSGFVMPAAIDKAIYIAISKRQDQEIHLYSESYQQAFQTVLSAVEISDTAWANFILGVVDQITKKGYEIGGFNLYIDGDVPLGAGLSSSAAVECATAHAISQLFSLSISKMDLAFIAQKAEHTFAGVNCGIMDQFASVFGKKDHAVVLDCKSMEYRYVPLNLEGHKLLLINSNVKHSLAESAYNQRRAKCEQGVAMIKVAYPDVESLRDVTIEQLDELVKKQDPVVYIKCRYIIEENSRLVKAAEYLEQGNLQALGKLMYETHEGLSRDYEVSCEELDFLVDAVKGSEYVLGARMMGGGFGGCTLNIVKNEMPDSFIQEIGKKYHTKFGHELSTYFVETSSGTEQLN